MAAMRFDDIAEAAFRHDRWVVSGLLGLVVLLAWAYTFAGVGMHDMDPASMGMTAAEHEAMMLRMGWSPAYAVLMFLMWWIMMIAMMLPSAMPMLLLHAAIGRKAGGEGSFATLAFALGYLIAWAIFSLVATTAQWGLERSGLLSPMSMAANAGLGGALLVAAGAYQLTPLKQACLGQCSNPFQFLTRRWRTGVSGAFRMGAEHGAWCLGCCWFLMALLFVGGVMNVLWIAGLALYVLVEKLAPNGRWLSHATGVALMLAGLIWWGVAYL
jgi:predicted metal-binding membrane protein